MSWQYCSLKVLNTCFSSIEYMDAIIFISIILRKKNIKIV